jgi:hypothetical protein
MLSRCQQIKLTRAENYVIITNRRVSWGKNCVETLTGLMRQKAYEIKAKKPSRDFTRKRKTTFAELIYFMLGMVKGSSQNALERFFPRIGKAYIPMSRQAFSAARQKVKGEALKELFQADATGSYLEEWERRRGVKYPRQSRGIAKVFRLTVVDGSFIQPHSEPELVQYYGGHGGFIREKDLLKGREGWARLGKERQKVG